MKLLEPLIEEESIYFFSSCQLVKIYRNFKILLFIGQHSNLCWLFICWHDKKKITLNKALLYHVICPDILLFFTRKVSSICPENWVEIFLKKHFYFYVQFLFSKKAATKFPTLFDNYLLNFFIIFWKGKCYFSKDFTHLLNRAMQNNVFKAILKLQSNFLLETNFSNFSCMFLNPNNFFQFEF